MIYLARPAGPQGPQGPQVWLDAQATEYQNGILLNWDVGADLFWPQVVEAMFDWFRQRTHQLLDEPASWQQPLTRVPPAVPSRSLKCLLRGLIRCIIASSATLKNILKPLCYSGEKTSGSAMVSLQLRRCLWPLFFCNSRALATVMPLPSVWGSERADYRGIGRISCRRNLCTMRY